MTRAVCRTIATVLSAIAIGGAAAQAKEPATVFTRARLTSSYEEPGGKLYVRLKLLPRSKIPFTTQTFRLPDRSLLADIPEGSWVRFTSKHIDGENTVITMQAAAECRRFQPCD
jgi:Cu/Ag efflux protein CusF